VRLPAREGEGVTGHERDGLGGEQDVQCACDDVHDLDVGVEAVELAASAATGFDELPFESWRVPYAAAGWSTAIFSYSLGDINAADLCRRLVL
jgi:hypothetical protein